MEDFDLKKKKRNQRKVKNKCLENIQHLAMLGLQKEKLTQQTWMSRNENFAISQIKTFVALSIERVSNKTTLFRTWAEFRWNIRL